MGKDASEKYAEAEESLPDAPAETESASDDGSLPAVPATGDAADASPMPDSPTLSDHRNSMSAEDKEKEAAKLANEQSQQQSAYEDAMSDRLPEVSTKLDYDEAKAEWKAAAVTDINGQYLSVCGSTYDDLEPLGPGIGLWFRTLKSLALYFGLMSLPVACMLANYLYLYYNPDSDLDEDTMEVLARVTTGVAATTLQEETIAGWDVRTIMLVIAALDCFAVLCFLIMIAHLKRRQDQYVEENDDAVTSLPDYTVWVWGIPKDATEEEVNKLFSQFGTVADVAVTKDIGKVMSARIKRANQLDNLMDLKIDAAAYTQKNMTTRLKIQNTRMDKLKEKIKKTNAKIEGKLNEGFDSVCAFVTFNEPESRAECVNAFRSQWRCCTAENLKLRGVHRLKIKPAPEASDLMWENIVRVSPVAQLIRKAISFLCILVLCLGAIGVIVYAKDVASNGPPAVSCANTAPSEINPIPNLHCAAVWNLQGEAAATNTSSQARKAVDMFIDNVDNDKCRQFISGGNWIRPMSNYSADGYAVAQLAALPAEGSAWTGGFIPGSAADECAAQTCKKCYCLSSNDRNNLVMDYIMGNEEGEENFCKPVYDQIIRELVVMIGTVITTTVTNLILMTSADLFSKFERHKTYSGTEANAAKYTFAALFVNQAMVPLIIYSFIEVLEGFPVLFQGEYTDFETAWYNKVMVTIMSTAMVNIVAFPMGAAMPNIIAMVQRWFTGCCAHSQKKLNEMYVPSEFSLAKRYGQMLCALFYTIIFLSAAPPLIPGACILFMALYVTDKMILLKFSKRPPMYDHKLNAQFLKFAPYAAWVHCALATWAFGYYEIPSYIVDPGDIVGKVGVDSDNLALLNENEVNDADLSGKPDQFEFMARLVRANALLPFAMFLVITVSLFFAKFFGALFKILCSAACQSEEKVDDVLPFDQLIFPGEAMYDEPQAEGETNNKLSGLRSYRLEDNPKYTRLFPEVLSADNSQRGMTPSKEKNTDAPESQTMA